MLARPAPFASPPPSTSAPDRDIAEDGGNQKAGLRKDKDVHHVLHTLNVPENIMDNPELPPRSSLRSSVTGVAIAGPPRQSLDAEKSGDHPPSPLHGQREIV